MDFLRKLFKRGESRVKELEQEAKNAIIAAEKTIEKDIRKLVEEEKSEFAQARETVRSKENELKTTVEGYVDAGKAEAKQAAVSLATKEHDLEQKMKEMVSTEKHKVEESAGAFVSQGNKITENVKQVAASGEERLEQYEKDFSKQEIEKKANEALDYGKEQYAETSRQLETEGKQLAENLKDSYDTQKAEYKDETHA